MNSKQVHRINIVQESQEHIKAVWISNLPELDSRRQRPTQIRKINRSLSSAFLPNLVEIQPGHLLFSPCMKKKDDDEFWTFDFAICKHIKRNHSKSAASFPSLCRLSQTPLSLRAACKIWRSEVQNLSHVHIMTPSTKMATWQGTCILLMPIDHKATPSPFPVISYQVKQQSTEVFSIMLLYSLYLLKV